MFDPLYVPHREIKNTELENLLEIEEQENEEVETKIYLANLAEALGVKALA